MISILHFLYQFYNKLTRRSKRWFFRGFDLLLSAVSIYLAFSLRFDLFEAWERLLPFKFFLFFVPFIYISMFWLCGLYKSVLKYAGFELWSIVVRGVLLSSAIQIMFLFLFKFSAFPRSILILNGLLVFIFAISLRIFIRWIIEHLQKTNSLLQKTQEKIVIFGAGDAGSQLLQSLKTELRYEIVAFIDDATSLQKQMIQGVPIFSRNDFLKKQSSLQPDSILLALPSISKKKQFELVQNIQEWGIPIKTIPSLYEIITGKTSITDIRKIDIIDLLGREEVKPNLTFLRKNIYQKSVAVTGAGGSIGSELCRQIAEQQPKELILIEQSEFALYQIDLELREAYPHLIIFPYLCSVRDETRLKYIFLQHSIETLYHAAAYKHVPLVESNPHEGVLNNIQGTLVLLKQAIAQKINKFVLISSDKAVRPTSIMGSTKRVAELILQAYANTKEIQTELVMVRFGNVLNSTGSVVPRFKKQIKYRKNITLTDKEMTRYFMSISEAARLVIQAGSLGSKGEVFLLDMGEPIKIYDLAQQMIQLSGLTLGKDIQIEITGLRPGEKLYEELLIDHNTSQKTSHPKIYSANEKCIPLKKLNTLLDELFKVAITKNKEEIQNCLQKFIPESQFNKN